jgi:hypothetical protein
MVQKKFKPNTTLSWRNASQMDTAAKHAQLNGKWNNNILTIEWSWNLNTPNIEVWSMLPMPQSELAQEKLQLLLRRLASHHHQKLQHQIKSQFQKTMEDLGLTLIGSNGWNNVKEKVCASTLVVPSTTCLCSMIKLDKQTRLLLKPKRFMPLKPLHLRALKEMNTKLLEIKLNHSDKETSKPKLVNKRTMLLIKNMWLHIEKLSNTVKARKSTLLRREVAVDHGAGAQEKLGWPRT